MIKLKRVVTDKGFILEEIDSEKINKELIKDGEVKKLDLPHVENNPESVQDHIDAIKEIVDKEKEEQEKKALETKSEDRAIFAESKLFKDRSEMTPFIVKLKEQKIRHRVVPLHEDKEGYKFELKYEKPLNEQLNESYETAFEVLKDGSKVSAVGSYKSTRNYTHELVDFEWKNGSGSGDYRWMNRPWERFSFAEALREAMINAGVDEKLAREVIEESYSLKSAIKLFADRYQEKASDEIKEDTIKQGNKWVNKGKEGTHGEFKTKKEADAQRKAMFAQGYKENLEELDKPAATSIEDAQKWVDYDMKHYGKISDNTNEIVKKAGYQIVKDDHGDYEVIAGKYESLKEEKEPKLETFDEQMDFLAKDEQEAIDGYEKVLALVDDEHVKEQLEKILEEERAHKKFLEDVKKDHSLVYSHEEEHEDEKEVEVEDDDSIDDFNFKDEVKVDEISWNDLDEEYEEDEDELLDDLDKDIDSKEREDDSKEDEKKEKELKETLSIWDDLED